MNCACQSDSVYECWSMRYGAPHQIMSCTEVEGDGGPCECKYHGDDEDVEGAGS